MAAAEMDTASGAERARIARNNVLRLATAQALAGANAAVIVATGAVVGSTLAPSPALVTLPISIYVVGTAIGTLPTGWIAQRHGRRAAFLTGTGCGAMTGLLAAVAIVIGSFALFCVAGLFCGFYAAVVQSFRFAAADGVSPQERPRALSWVMAGGVFAGILGPQLVTWTMDLWQPYVFAASFLAQTAVAGVAAIVLSGVNLPKPAPADLAAGRPLRIIIRQPRFITAVLCGTVAQVLMNLVMTSAPLAMRFCGLPQSASNMAIEWHVVAMYGTSFVTGTLITRFGAGRVVAAGLFLTIGSALTGLSGLSTVHFIAMMTLLGFGWNFGFVGASALVLQTHRPEEKTKVQAFNDFLVFGTAAVGSFASGQVLTSHGWSAVNLIVFPPIAVAFVVLVSSGLLRSRNTVAAS